MKNIFAIFMIGFSTISIAQNVAPVAINDTLHYAYNDVHELDSFFIDLEILDNDYDPDGHIFVLDEIIYSGQNSLTGHKPLDQIIWMVYKPIPGYEGTETFQYIIRDLGSPNLYDTATVTLVIMQKGYEVLDANNIMAVIDKEILFSSPKHDKSGFEAPAGTGHHSIFGANLWITGMDQGILYSNIREYGATPNNHGYTSNNGPVSNTSHTQFQFNSIWNRVWKVSQTDINYHLANWSTTGYSPPESLLDWPAHGDVANGESEFLAPFYDQNQDQVYNPFQGDYPLIKGDQAIYFIYNDGNSPISNHPMKAEVHGMAYAFSCPDSALQNTIFVDYKIYNRSPLTYQSVYIAMWSDMDLGNALDDYVGCDVDRSLFYTYNADDFDDDAIGLYGYGNHPAAQGVLLLQGVKQNADGKDNAFGTGTNESVNGRGFGDGISDNEYWGLEYLQYYTNGGGGAPNSEVQYFYTMRGLDFSGQPWAADLLQNGTSIPYKFVFPDNSDSLQYGTFGTMVNPWNEITMGNVPSDRRVTGSSGPFTFSPGGVIELQYAFIFGRDYVNTGAQAGLTNMIQRSDSIQSYFNQGILEPCEPPLSVKNHFENNGLIEVFPNPVQSSVTIRQSSNSLLQITVFDATGKVSQIVSSNQIETTINMAGLASGLYFIKVTNKEMNVVKKVIKR